jgi:hypothetical protein
MAQTESTFTRDQRSAEIPGLPGGNRIYAISGSFNGTNTTYTFEPPTMNVVAVVPLGTPMQITTGSTLDRIVCDNTQNSSGLLTLISDGTANKLIQLSRAGSNNQDFTAILLTK